MSANTSTNHFKLHVNELYCTQVTADIFFLLATCTQPVLASVRKWHADFPVPVFLLNLLEFLFYFYFIYHNKKN